MDALFTLTSTRAADPAISRWFAEKPAALSSLALTCFRLMKGLGNDVLEVSHDGAPTACVGNYPFAYVNAFKAHVNVGFFYGAFLQDPQGLLEGSGKRMRHVKLKPGEILYEQPVHSLIIQAYADLRHRITLLENEK